MPSHREDIRFFWSDIAAIFSTNKITTMRLAKRNTRKTIGAFNLVMNGTTICDKCYDCYRKGENDEYQDSDGISAFGNVACRLREQTGQ